MRYIYMGLSLMWLVLGTNSALRCMARGSGLDAILVILSILMVVVNLKRSELI